MRKIPCISIILLVLVIVPILFCPVIQAKDFLVPWGGEAQYVHQLDSCSVLIYVDSIRAAAIKKGIKGVDAVQLYMGRILAPPDNSYGYYIRPSFGQQTAYFSLTTEDNGYIVPMSYMIFEDTTLTSRYYTIEQDVPGSVNQLKITLKMAQYNTNFSPLSICATWKYSSISTAAGGNSER